VEKNISPATVQWMKSDAKKAPVMRARVTHFEVCVSNWILDNFLFLISSISRADLLRIWSVRRRESDDGLLGLRGETSREWPTLGQR